MFAHPRFEDYALLDSGDGEKLERFGEVALRRPDPQALWHKRLPEERWASADLSFERDAHSGGQRGHWIASAGARPQVRKPAPEWTVTWHGTRCVVRPTPFKHVGLFPEQASNWELVERAGRLELPEKRLLNLFGYTGTASVVAARSGFQVTHVDASKTSLAWAKENAAASGLAADALRIVLDDALAFARREMRRGSRYEGILLDPPHYGRGPRGEVWQFEEHVAQLIDVCAKLLAPRSFLVLSTYAIGCSPLTLRNLLAELDPALDPERAIAAGELALPESEGALPRRLPAGFCARWSRGLELELP
jgi:23S rRNA (cytosine1962-C5)-methyltransferase